MRISLKHINAGVLSVAYLEEGPSNGLPVILLHGFPYGPESYSAVAKYLATRGLRCIRPYLRGYGPTRFLSPETLRSGQQAALGADLLAFMNALSINTALLAGFDWGGRAACIAAALWPDRVIGLISSGNGYNIQDIAGAEDEHRFWYQYYFHSERGYKALIDRKQDLCKFLWKLWSPTWNFDDSTFSGSIQTFENPDFADIVAHSYRHRFNLVAGDPAYGEIEARLALQPVIQVPSIILEGKDDGVDPPMPFDLDRPHFVGRYEKILVSNAGHNLPQEVPEQYAEAVMRLVP